MCQEHTHIRTVLFLVARLAGERQVRGPVAAAVRPGLDMLDLERDVLCVTVGAFAAPLLQQVLPQLVACQGPLLVLHTVDLGVLHRLSVELHQLLTQRRDRRQLHESAHPGHRRIDPVLQGRRDPARRPGPVIEPGRPVAGLAVAPSPAQGPAVGKRLADGGTPMLQLGREDDHVFFNKRDSGHLASRVDLDLHGSDNRVKPNFLQDDREGIAPEHCRAPGPQHLSCPRRMARRQWPPRRIQHKYCVRLGDRSHRFNSSLGFPR